MLILQHAVWSEFNVAGLCITIKLSSTLFVKVLQAASVVVISDWKEIIVASNGDILNRSLISCMFDNTPMFKANHIKVSVCTVFLGESICKLHGFSSRLCCSNTEL